MKSVIAVILLVVSGTTLIQAQAQTHSRSRASDSLSSISFSASNVVGGESLIGTVHLTSPAPAEGAIVALALDDPSGSSAIPASVVVPPGATSANFVIRTNSVTSSLNVIISGTYRVTRYASFLLTDGSASSEARIHDLEEDLTLMRTPTFQDSFNEGVLNTSKWVVSNYESNDYAGGGSNVTFSPGNIDLSGGSLRMELTQPTAGSSFGAELTTKLRFGYGTYQFSMRAGSTSPTSEGTGTTESGQISSTFIIYNPPIHRIASRKSQEPRALATMSG